MRTTSTANNFIANTASIVAEAFKAPAEDSLILSFKAPEKETGPTASADIARVQPAPEPEKETVVNSHFKMIFLSVLVLRVRPKASYWIA